VVVGGTWGRVRAMFNDVGKRVRKAEPSMPVEILGLDSVAEVGDSLTAVAGEQQARASMQKRQQAMPARAVSLDNLYDQLSTGQVKELNVILKADVQGSIEPIRSSLERLATDKVQVRIIHSGSGNITESDVMLAIASKGLIIGFGTAVEAGARRLADVEGVDIRSYDVIYNLVDDVEKALKGMLEPTYKEVIDGRAEVKEVFPSGKKGKVAGVSVSEGKLSRGASVRLRRGEQIIIESEVASLRRFKDDVKEVATGYECGVGLKDFEDFEVGDILETFRKERAS
jgi:translation initiation factor IF-2